MDSHILFDGMVGSHIFPSLGLFTCNTDYCQLQQGDFFTNEWISPMEKKNIKAFKSTKFWFSGQALNTYKPSVIRS